MSNSFALFSKILLFTCCVIKRFFYEKFQVKLSGTEMSLNLFVRIFFLQHFDIYEFVLVFNSSLNSFVCYAMVTQFRAVSFKAMNSSAVPLKVPSLLVFLLW